MHATSCSDTTLAMGLAISSAKKGRYIEGHNQDWYRLKKRLIDHISCASKKNGGDRHYQALTSKRQRDIRNRGVMNIVRNQLKSALTIIKTKSASRHYEHIIALLSSCGSSVGNHGHGRKQVNAMLKAFQTYINKKTPLLSTGLPPHFCTSSDRSFCIDICGFINILIPLMEMMVKVQAIHQFIWSITKYWSRVRNRLIRAIEELEKKMENDEACFPKDILPNLNEHCARLSEEDPTSCTFKNITFCPGWMVVEETDVPAEMEEVQISGKNSRRRKVIDWVDRTPDDCLSELLNFSNCLKRNMDSRYEKCVSDAAHTLEQCMYIPDIFVFAQGQTVELPAKELASIQTYSRKEFAKFYKYVCSLPQVKSLAESNDQLRFWPVFAPNVHSHFKEVVVDVI